MVRKSTYCSVGAIPILVSLTLMPVDALADGIVIPIPSGDVERLYSVVGDPANVNKTVVLSPGIYVLSASGPSGPRPRGGGLMLQEGMKLVGSNAYADVDHDGVWDATFDETPVVSGETVIDGTSVAPFPAVSPNGQPEVDCLGVSVDELLASGAAVIYRNRNTVSRVTILAAQGQFALGAAHSAYMPSKGYVVEISNTFIDGGFNGFGGAAFHNMGCRMRDAESTLVFKNNIVRGNLFGLAAVNGLTNQRGDQPRGPTLHAIVTGTHFIANNVGVHARNSLGTDGGWIDLRSTGNLFEYNTVGLEATAGTNFGAMSGSIENQFDLASSQDRFFGNTTGVVGVAAWRDNPNDNLPGVSRNELRMTLQTDRFDGGDAVHVWPLFPLPRKALDVGNRVTAYVRGSESGSDPKPSFLFIDPVPSDTNSTQLVGSTAGFRASNGAPPTFMQYLVPLHPFDLTGTKAKLRFTPVATRYQVTASAGLVDPDVGATLDFTGGPPVSFPGDDDTTEVAMPFVFPFEGRAYTSVWVNTDGNLTFGEGDSESTSRDVARFVSGPPRIAALFSDVAPNMGGSVHSKVFPDRLVITWLDVPTYEANLFDQNTFQVVLHGDGAIDIVYDAIAAPNSVVGIGPGEDFGPAPPTVDLSNSTATESTLYETFVGTVIGP